MTTRLAALALLATTAAVSAQGYEPFPTVGGAPRVDLPAVRQTAPSLPSLTAPDVTGLGTAGVSRSGVAPALIESEARARASAATERPAPASTATTAPTAAVPARPAPRLSVGQSVVGVATVHDGHSVVVRGEPIRLDGVEAPAAAQTCTTRSGTAWRCGERSRERLTALVAGTDLSCVVTAPAGSGSAARCSTRSAADVGSILVSEGLAVPNATGRERYAGELRSAVAARTGLWSGGFDDPARWRSSRPGG